MKRLIMMVAVLAVILAMVSGTSGCSTKTAEQGSAKSAAAQNVHADASDVSEGTGTDMPPKPQLEQMKSQMKSICELATVECYYSNLAKYFEEDAEGMWWWTKDKKFWIEYAGIVKVGVDISKVKITAADNVISISVPPAKVLSCKVDEKRLTADSFYLDRDSAHIEADDQQYAFAEAQKVIYEAASSDSILLMNARDKVISLLERYIVNINQIADADYVIEWKYQEESAQTEQTTEAETETQ